MRHVAAIPAVGLLAGAAFGIAVADLPRDPAALFLILCVSLAAWAWRSANRRLLAAVAVAAFFTGGGLLANNAWERAWRPPLRTVFEALAPGGRAAAAREGRRLREGDGAGARVPGSVRPRAADRRWSERSKVALWPTSRRLEPCSTKR